MARGTNTEQKKRVEECIEALTEADEWVLITSNKQGIFVKCGINSKVNAIGKLEWAKYMLLKDYDMED